MPKLHDKRTARIPHTDKSITTMLRQKHVDVNDLLTHDDVTEVLNTVIANKAKITDIVVLYKTRDGSINEEHTPNTRSSTAVYMMELAKFDVLKDNTADTEDD